MCVIVYKPKGVEFKTKDIIRCFRANPHGAGLMYWSEYGLHVDKGFMNVKSLIEHVKMLGDINLAVHFRYATHGLKNQHQTHPFVVSRKISRAKTDRGIGAVLPVSGQALMHNGVLRRFGSRVISDTLDMVTSALASRRTTKERRDFLQGLPGHYCLAADGKFFLFGGFEKVKGLSCSNLYWVSDRDWVFNVGNTSAAKPLAAKWALPKDVDRDEWEAWLSQDCYSYMDKP